MPSAVSVFDSLLDSVMTSEKDLIICSSCFGFLVVTSSWTGFKVEVDFTLLSVGSAFGTTFSILFCLDATTDSDSFKSDSVFWFVVIVS